MRIENGGQPVRPRTQTGDASQAQASSAGQSKGIDGTSTTIDVKSIENLLALVSDSTKIRESVVAEVKTKIQNDEYLARADAVETARSILNL